MDRQMNSGHMDRQTYGYSLTDRQTDGLRYSETEGQTNRQMDRQIKGQMDRQRNRHMDRWIDN